MLPKSLTAAACCTELIEFQVNKDRETRMKRFLLRFWNGSAS